MKKFIFSLSILALIPKTASAHCPLCTAGAGALAVLAASLGVSSVVVGVLIGAFALALSLWLAGTIKKQYVPYQKYILIVIIFLGTIVPIMPLIEHYAPFYVPFIGEYGTTYAVNLYIVGVVIGSAIMFLSPFISSGLTRIRNEQLPFQGISITLTLLIVTSVVIQLLA